MQLCKEPEKDFGVSVVIPAYNEEDAIIREIDEVETVLRGTGRPFEIIVVDDGSSDHTAERAATCNVKLIRRGGNYGYGAALKAGIAESRFDWILIIDADGTYPAAAIPELLALAPEFDMAVGARTGRNVHVSRLRQPAKWLLRMYAGYLTGQHIPDLNSGLRLMRKRVVKGFEHLLPSGFSFTTTITLSMISNGYKVAYVPIDYFARVGKSKIRPMDFFRFFKLITRLMFLFNPLGLVVPVAALLLFLGFLDFRYDAIPVDRSGVGLAGMSGAMLAAAGFTHRRARQRYGTPARDGEPGRLRRLFNSPPIRVAGSLLLLLLLIWFFPEARLMKALAGIPPMILASSVAMFLMVHTLGAWKWHLLVNRAGAGIAFPASVRLYFNGLFGNLYLPSIIGGDVVMVMLARRETRSQGAVLLGSVMNRVLDLAGLVVISALGAIILGGELDARNLRFLTIALAVTAVAGAAFVAAVLLLHPDRLPGKLRAHYLKHRDVIECLRHPRMYLLPAAIGVAMQVALAGLTSWIGHACGLSIGWGVWLLAWPMAKLLAVVPITLGGIGAREVGLVVLLSPFGVSPALAIATGLAWDGVLMMGSLLAGALARLLALASPLEAEPRG